MAGFLVVYSNAMRKKSKMTLDRVAALVERGFAAVADDMSKLATKEDVIQLGKQLYSIEQELKDIKRRLTTLEDEFGSINKRYKQEMEELWKHVTAIERRLKMQR